MGIQTLIISVAFLLFAIIFIVPVLGNIDDVQKGGLISLISYIILILVSAGWLLYDEKKKKKAA